MKLQFLIANHDLPTAEALRRCLKSRGYDASVATTGLQCVDQLRHTPPRVLLLDPDMLWGGGEGVLEWLNSQPESASPVIVLADRQQSPHIARRFESQVDARIEPPGCPEDVPQIVNQLEAVAWWTFEPATRG